MRFRWISTAGFAAACMTCLLGHAPDVAQAHGSVTPDADLCIIRIGYFKAHFKVYLPQTRAHQDYCEDLPDTGSAIFVMEYEHDGLAEVPIDFRIIKNVTQQGRFTRSEHISDILDLEPVTVFHHSFSIQPDVFTVAHDFDEPGEFVGIVTVRRDDIDKEYVAVFPFEVGYTGFGYWPWIIAAAVLLQIHFLWMNGWFRRLAGRRSPPRLSIVKCLATVSKPFVAVLLLMHPAAVVHTADSDDGSPEFVSLAGHFVTHYRSDLEPLAINRIHNWVLHVDDANGRPVTGATITLEGGMPAHDHGLPTAPQVTRELGNGDYLVEGLRFHMNGEWQIEVTIESAETRDVVYIPLAL